MLDYYFENEGLGMFTPGAEWQPMRADATQNEGRRDSGAPKMRRKSDAPINTAIEKQSWYVAIYQQLRVFHKRTKLVCC